jgi:TPR repeat protein
MKSFLGRKFGTDNGADVRSSGAIPAWRSSVLLFAGFVTLASPVLADSPTFADLLSRAEAQAAAGHRWAPHGDNVAETVEAMMDLIPTATPKQLAELAALLNSDMARAGNDPALPPANTQPMVTPPPNPPPVPDRSAMPDRGPPSDQPVVAASKPVPDRTVATPPPSVPDRPILKPATSVPVRSSPRAAELLARGQAAERAGDVSGARRFYASAAELGSATAARDLGRLYDPAHLQRTALGGIDPDPALARHWYERAVAMGDAEAAPLLEALALR